MEEKVNGINKEKLINDIKDMYIVSKIETINLGILIFTTFGITALIYSVQYHITNPQGISWLMLTGLFSMFLMSFLLIIQRFNKRKEYTPLKERYKLSEKNIFPNEKMTKLKLENYSDKELDYLLKFKENLYQEAGCPMKFHPSRRCSTYKTYSSVMSTITGNVLAVKEERK